MFSVVPLGEYTDSYYIKNVQYMYLYLFISAISVGTDLTNSAKFVTRGLLEACNRSIIEKTRVFD